MLKEHLHSHTNRNSSLREVERKPSLILIERIGGGVGNPPLGRFKVEEMLGQDSQR